MRRLLAPLGVAALLLFVPGVASAHPLGNFTINVYAGIELRPNVVELDYVVDMAEIPTFQTVPNIDADGDGEVEAAELDAWAGDQAVRLEHGIELRESGRPVELGVATATASLRAGQGGLHTLRLEVAFRGPVDRAGTIALRDDNFADRIGWHEMTAVGMDGEAVWRSSVPATSVSERLLAYPTDLLQSPLRVTAATVRYRPGHASVEVAGEPVRDTGSARPGVADGAFAALIGRRGGWLIALGLVLAAGFGALHALGPGHGKTLMAAYLVGSGGGIRHAAAIGAAVAAMHSASVLTLGLAVLGAERVFPVERVYGWLGLVSGVVALGLGAALLVVRRRGRAPHVHSHEHGHEDGHHHGGPLSRRGLVALALAGGILPSPSALVVLLGSISVGRLALGLGLIGAFSVGMAATLVGVGAVAFRARAIVERRVPPIAERLLPMGSAAAILVLGAVLTIRALVRL